MTRLLLNFLTVLSLLLCASVVWLTWCPRGRGAHTFHRTPGGTYYAVSLYRGAVAFERSTRTVSVGPGLEGRPPAAWGHSSGFPAAVPPPQTGWNRLGFRHWPNGMRIVNENYEVIGHQTWVVPRWLVILPLTFPALAWGITRLRRRSKRRPGLCRSCGYDLTGNLSGVCPECGGGSGWPIGSPPA